ncbi:hypothetical protein DN437_09090 [Lactobacillus reuteri]|nr:hypothetical protein [Limosilactobacillus reuteri]
MLILVGIVTLSMRRKILRCRNGIGGMEKLIGRSPFTQDMVSGIRISLLVDTMVWKKLKWVSI